MDEGAAAPSRGPATLSEVVYEQILSLIMGGHLPANSRLPPEQELSARYAVSRPVVRTALARLREDGLITSRRGSGSYVLRQPAQAVLQFAPVSSINDIQNCFKIRIGIEGEAAYAAATNHDERQLESIEVAFQVLEEALHTGALAVHPDYNFHLAVAEAAGNRFMVSTMIALKEHIAFAMNLTRNLSLMRTAKRLAIVQDEHRAILAAVRARDALGARTCMREHLENARRRMFEGDLESRNG